jgi:NAD dependent epimerase/dehydratase family enzyme
MSWIALTTTGAIHHAVVNDSLISAVNAVSPNAVTNAEFQDHGTRSFPSTLFPVAAAASHRFWRNG